MTNLKKQKACVQCGVESPTATCKSCKNAKKRLVRATNGDDVRAKEKAYFDQNKSEISKKRAAYRLKNLEVMRKRNSDYKEKNSESINAAYRLRYEQNKLEIRASRVIYRQENHERMLAREAVYRSANQDKINLGAVRRYSENPEKNKESGALWRSKNIDKVRDGARKWARNNPEARRILHQNRRERKRLGGGALSRGLSAKLFALQKGRCPCCGLPLGDDYHMDHKVPLALGGEHADSNIQLLRSICNQQKKDKHPVDFMQSRGFLL